MSGTSSVRLVRVLASVAIGYWLFGCERAQQPAPAQAAAPAAQAPAAPAKPAELGDLLPKLPSHWTNDKDIGRGKGGVTDAQLAAGTSDPTEWLLYGGNYANYRLSPIKALTPAAASTLQVAWVFPTGTLGQFEVSPVVHDGIMYVTSSYNRLFALDAATGELYWRYDHKQPDDLRICCGPVNRGVGIKGDIVMMATLDAHLIAFERRSGEIKWDVELASYKDGYSATSAPMVVKNMAIIGVAGGEYGVRGFFDAYDVETGKRVWRHYTMPAAGEPGAESWAGKSAASGGAPAWTSGAYDAETDTLFWTTGNPGPDWNGDDRSGDNLYADSILALDPATGQRKWYFQFTPHDVWDYDGNTQIFLVDIDVDGKPVKAVVQANRNGFFYILDRTTGAYLKSAPYPDQAPNWATIDEKGRPTVNPQAVPLENPDYRVCPGNMGGMNGAWSGAYNPTLKLVYIPTIEACQQFQKGIVAYVNGQPFVGGLPVTVDVNNKVAYGDLNAIDVTTGKVRWRFKDKDPVSSGALATAGGVVFIGTGDGHAVALDAATGAEVWRFRVGGGVRSQPIAYQQGDDVYVAIGAGNWATITSFQGGNVKVPEGGELVVFKLPRHH